MPVCAAGKGTRRKRKGKSQATPAAVPTECTSGTSTSIDRLASGPCSGDTTVDHAKGPNPHAGIASDVALADSTESVRTLGSSVNDDASDASDAASQEDTTCAALDRPAGDTASPEDANPDAPEDAAAGTACAVTPEN